MAKRPKVSLEDITANDVSTLKRDDVVTSTPASMPAAVSRSHVSLYLPKAVQREVKLIAIGRDLKAHDIYIEAVDMILRHYGRPTVAELRDAE